MPCSATPPSSSTTRTSARRLLSQSPTARATRCSTCARIGCSRVIYGEDDYARRINALRQRRYYGSPANERTGILRYTKVLNSLINMNDIPLPTTEWELSRLLSFYWNLDRSYETVTDAAAHRSEGERPSDGLLVTLAEACARGADEGLALDSAARAALGELGL